MTSVSKLQTVDLDGVAETLMITLYARVVESQRPEPILVDAKAVEIAAQVDYEFSKYAAGWASQLGCVIRVKEIDQLAQAFMSQHPNALVVNLGAGLCTRFFRIDNGSVHWYEVDFPEVMGLKQCLIPQGDRYHYISSSILDFSWIDQIPFSPQQPLLILMEGVSMYLSEVGNRALLRKMSDRLAPAQMILDVLGRQAKDSKSTRKHDTVSQTNASFKWGTDHPQEIEQWAGNIRVAEQIFYLPQFANYPDRLKPFWIRWFRRILIPLFKHKTRILVLQIE
jgi:O-methyltransferase involved in polyketide biosynthesis